MTDRSEIDEHYAASNNNYDAGYSDAMEFAQADNERLRAREIELHNMLSEVLRVVRAYHPSGSIWDRVRAVLAKTETTT